MSIQRWKFLTLADDNGDLVTYADHVAALAEEQETAHRIYGYRNGYAAALVAARDAVAALDRRSSDEGWFLYVTDILAAIDALTEGESNG